MSRANFVLDRYELLERVGEGGMGVVYKALDHERGKLVAVKRIASPSAPMLERFRVEASVLARLEHPAIVRYLDQAYTDAGDAILVLEWLEGETLTSLLARRRPSVREVIALALRIAAALASAHERGIVHRDIKPSNIVIEGDELARAKLLDFGIARLAGARTITQTGMIVGTAGYMAPEQARGDHSLGPAADVFSLGCVLFECLCGRPAFRGHHAMALLAKLLLEQPPPLLELEPTLPRALAELIDTMLAKSVEQRPADGATLERRLVALDELGRSASDPSPPAVSSAERHHRSIVVIAPDTPLELAETASAELVTASELREAVERAVVPLGAEVEVLYDGTVLVMLSDEHVQPREQALLAARCALWARESARAPVLALVTGWSERRGHAPVGELLDRAAELLAREPLPEAHGGRGVILVDATTRELIDERFEVHDEDGVLVLRAERPLGDMRRVLLGRSSPFVGRERDLRNLRELVETAFDEREPVVALVLGEAGIGKSRLRQELAAALREREPDLQILLGRADLLASDSPLSLLASLFRSALDIGEGEEPERAREKIEFAVSVCVAAAERRRVAEFLGEMMRVRFPDHDSPRLRAARNNPQIMADQVTRAYVEFVCGFAKLFSAVIVLEDLQWSDSASLELLDALLAELRDCRYVVIALARPELDERFPKLWARRRVQRVSLAPLSRRASRELVRTVLGASIDDSQAESLVEHAGGHPLFLEELIRSHAQGRSEQLPASLLGLLEARLAGQSSETRRLLRAASVFGETFWSSGLQALIGDPSGELHIDTLIDAELIVPREPSRFAGQPEYAFRHALMREGVYATLTSHDRKLAHARAATWLLDAGEHDASVLAHHFERGGELERAIEFHGRAAEQALALSDFTVARRCAERGLALQPEPERVASLWSVIADAAFWTRDHEAAIRAAERALAGLRPGTRDACRALGVLIAAGLFRLGSASRSLEILERLLATEPEPDALPALAFGFDAAMLYLVCVEPSEAIHQHVVRLAELAGRAPGELLVQAWSDNARASWCRAIGAVGPALRHSSAATRGFEQAAYRQFLPYSYAYGAMDRLLLGDFEGAEASLRRALALALPSSVQEFVARHFTGCLALVRGELERAESFADPIFAAADARGEQLPRLLAGLVQAEVALARGELDRAESKLLALRSGAALFPFQRTWYATELARLRIRQGRLDAAELALAEALALREELGRTHFQKVAALDVVHVELALARGRVEQARMLCDDACERLLARAEAVDEPALRRAFLDVFPDNVRLLTLQRSVRAPALSHDRP